jgi:hypothetical protein
MPDTDETNNQNKESSTASDKVSSSPSKKASSKKSSKKRNTQKGRKSRKTATKSAKGLIAGQAAKYPRYAVDKALRVPKAILEQNAGKECTDREAAQFLGVSLSGAVQVEINSALKYGFLRRPAPGRLEVTDLARKAIRPQEPKDVIESYRTAVLRAPDMSAVYKHYRGENLPDDQFFDNALTDNFKIPQEKLSEFKSIFIDSLKAAKLIEEHGDKMRVLDVSQEIPAFNEGPEIKKLGKAAGIDANDTCFVVMPFEPPLGDYYSLIYEQAIVKAGLKPVRADAEIFGTGKIMDQIWAGINSAKVLVAELTTRNPNVFYELGIAHALRKPVVLISSNEGDVPFDVRHIRVIYYDVNDPFWGSKLLDKVAENIISAIKNPEEAIFNNPV